MHDAKMASSVEYAYDPSVYDACMKVTNLYVWYFCNGASKPIIS